jgi:hypothetical protein
MARVRAAIALVSIFAMVGSTAAQAVEASAPATPPVEEPTGEEIESSGDYICHAGIDNLPNLTRGAKSQYDVLALQVALAQLGYSPGPIDGLFGKRKIERV